MKFHLAKNTSRIQWWSQRFSRTAFLPQDQHWMNGCTGTRLAHMLWLCPVVLSYWNGTKSQINMALETSFHLHTETWNVSLTTSKWSSLLHPRWESQRPLLAAWCSVLLLWNYTCLLSTNPSSLIHFVAQQTSTWRSEEDISWTIISEGRWQSLKSRKIFFCLLGWDS